MYGSMPELIRPIQAKLERMSYADKDALILVLLEGAWLEAEIGEMRFEQLLELCEPALMDTRKGEA